MIHKVEYISVDIHKYIPKISVNWNSDNLKYYLANEQFRFECFKFNPLVIKDNDDLPAMNRIIVEQLMKKLNY